MVTPLLLGLPVALDSKEQKREKLVVPLGPETLEMSGASDSLEHLSRCLHCLLSPRFSKMVLTLAGQT